VKVVEEDAAAAHAAVAVAAEDRMFRDPGVFFAMEEASEEASLRCCLQPKLPPFAVLPPLLPELRL